MSSVEGIIGQTKRGSLGSSFAALVLIAALSLYNSCTSSSNGKGLSSHDATMSVATAEDITDTLAYLHGQITDIQERERLYRDVFHGRAGVDTVARQQLLDLSGKYAALLATIDDTPDDTPDDTLPQTSVVGLPQGRRYLTPLGIRMEKTVEDDPQ